MNGAPIGGGYAYRGTNTLDDTLMDVRGTPVACREKRGTTAGYWQHRRRREKPCEECREAHNAYVRERRQADGGKARRAAAMRARTRAWRKLARRHPGEYRALLLVELDKVTAEIAATQDGAQ